MLLCTTKFLTAPSWPIPPTLPISGGWWGLFCLRGTFISITAYVCPGNCCVGRIKKIYPPITVREIGAKNVMDGENDGYIIPWADTLFSCWKNWGKRKQTTGEPRHETGSPFHEFLCLVSAGVRCTKQTLGDQTGHMKTNLKRERKTWQGEVQKRTRYLRTFDLHRRSPLHSGTGALGKWTAFGTVPRPQKCCHTWSHSSW